MEKADIIKKIHLALVTLIFYIQKGTAFSTSPSALTSCASSTANISFNFSIDAGESIFGKRTWTFGADKIAESNGTTLTPVPSYSSRLTAYGTSGISLSNITVADAGTYTYVIVLSPTLDPFIATTTLSVQVAPLAPPSGCQVSATQSSNILTCAVNTDSGNCGTPSLNAFWVNSANTSNQIKCNVGETYQCCATSAALTCYSGSSNHFCKLFNCTDVNTTTTTGSDNKAAKIGGGVGGGVGAVLIAAGGYGGYRRYQYNKKRKEEKAHGEDSEAQNDGENKDKQKKKAKDEKELSEPKQPPATNIRNQNRVESEATSKKTKDRPQPMPPVPVVTEDISKHRPQPPPPENSDVKDPNKRGLSANYNDTQGLPTGTPRPNRLTPLTPKQATVEEEDASKEKPKKKQKNKKKKGQMNEENQVEEMEESQSKKPLTGDQSDGD